jgi:hypothetical protein
VISHSTIAHFSTVFHESTQSPSTNSGHGLEIDAGSQLEDVGTATSSTMVEMISPSSNVDPFITPKTRTRLTSKDSGHCLESHNGSHSALFEGRDNNRAHEEFFNTLISGLKKKNQRGDRMSVHD